MDKREIPKYSLAEAAWILGLPGSTVRRWLGQAQGAQGVIEPAQDKPIALSFFNLAELYVLATIRRKHEVRLESVRRALATLDRLAPGPHPLLAEDLLTDGVSLFTKAYGDLVNLSQAGQVALAELLDASLRRIDRDAAGLPKRLYPWHDAPGEERLLAIDPELNFGRLSVVGPWIPVDVLADFFRAGDSIDLLAKGYGIERSLVEAAVRWDNIAKAA